MSKTSKRTTPDTDYVYGPDTSDNTSGELVHPISGDSVPSRLPKEDGDHSMFGKYHGVLASMPHGFEGGIRGGGVSAIETLPNQARVHKRGYDEHTGGVSGGASVHNVNDVEGIDYGEVGEEAETGKEAQKEGFSCGLCGGAFRAKTPHGLARHIHSKHGKFRGLGEALRYSTSEKPVAPSSVEVTSMLGRHTVTADTTISSYTAGDKGGSCRQAEKV